LCRHHRHPDHIARTIKAASNRAEINTRVTSHVLRHSYATHAHEQGVPMRTLMQLLGHNAIRTTEIYVHADEHQATAAKSPLETLLASKTMAEKTHVANRQELKLRLFTG
jgi:integrase